MLELTIEGATLPVLVLGVIALIVAVARRNRAMVPLATAAAVFFLQFVLIGAGKPAEYGRFGIFTNTALAIGTACLLARHWARYVDIARRIAVPCVVIWTTLSGAAYLWNFHLDTAAQGSRMKLAASFAGLRQEAGKAGRPLGFATTAEPAPYCFPAIDFSTADVVLLESREQLATLPTVDEYLLAEAVDQQSDTTYGPLEGSNRQAVGRIHRFWPHEAPASRLLSRIMAEETPVSWANKPFDMMASERMLDLILTTNTFPGAAGIGEGDSSGLRTRPTPSSRPEK